MATALNNTVSPFNLSNSTTTPSTPTSGSTVFSRGGGLYVLDTAGNIWPLADPSGNQSGVVPGVLAETNHRYNVSGSAQPTSGSLYIMAISLVAGQTVNNIGFGTGTTATTNASHCWQAILDNTYKQQGHTADTTTTNLAASTWYKNALVTPYTATYTGAYYLALMLAVSAGSTASILGPTFTPAAQMITGTNVPTPLIGGVSSTGLTTPGTDGTTTYIAPTAAFNNFYMYASV